MPSEGCSLGHHVATTSNKETDTSIISAIGYKEKTMTVRNCHSSCTYLVDCCADFSTFSATTTEEVMPPEQLSCSCQQLSSKRAFVAHYRVLYPFLICCNNQFLWLLGYHIYTYCTMTTNDHAWLHTPIAVCSLTIDSHLNNKIPFNHNDHYLTIFDHQL